MLFCHFHPGSNCAGFHMTVTLQREQTVIVAVKHPMLLFLTQGDLTQGDLTQGDPNRTVLPHTHDD
jgi:hypothetical protein